MKPLHLKIEFNEHMIKKIALEALTPRANVDDYDGYFYLDKLGSPVFVLETKEEN